MHILLCFNFDNEMLRLGTDRLAGKIRGTKNLKFYVSPYLLVDSQGAKPSTFKLEDMINLKSKQANEA